MNAKWTSGPRVSRPIEELQPMLEEHLDVLVSHCRNFDSGKEHFAAEIANNLRVLLFDNPTNGNRSLLQQMNGEGTPFFDTTRTLTQDEPGVVIAPLSGLATAVVLERPEGLIQEWRATCERRPVEERMYTPFPEWWERTILTSAAGDPFCRRRIVRSIANQDRGSHVAPGIEKAYFDLTRGDGHVQFPIICIEGDAVTDPSLPIAPERIRQPSMEGAGRKVARALVRAIAHEVLLTLFNDADRYMDGFPSPDFGVAPIVFVKCWSDPAKQA